MSSIIQAPTQFPLPPASAQPPPDIDVVDRVRLRVAELIADLEAAGTEAGAPAARATSTGGHPAMLKLRILRQLSGALADVRPRDLTLDEAGLGSLLTLEDCVTGEYLEYLLMTGDLVDVEAGQVSIGSPIGQAVLGRRAGDSIDVLLPRGRRAFRVAALTTLPAALGLGRPALRGRNRNRGRSASRSA